MNTSSIFFEKHSNGSILFKKRTIISTNVNSDITRLPGATITIRIFRITSESLDTLFNFVLNVILNFHKVPYPKYTNILQLYLILKVRKRATLMAYANDFEKIVIESCIQDLVITVKMTSSIIKNLMKKKRLQLPPERQKLYAKTKTEYHPHSRKRPTKTKKVIRYSAPETLTLFGHNKEFNFNGEVITRAGKSTIFTKGFDTCSGIVHRYRLQPGIEISINLRFTSDTSIPSTP